MMNMPELVSHWVAIVYISLANPNADIALEKLTIVPHVPFGSYTECYTSRDDIVTLSLLTLSQYGMNVNELGESLKIEPECVRLTRYQTKKYTWNPATKAPSNTDELYEPENDKDEE